MNMFLLCFPFVSLGLCVCVVLSAGTLSRPESTSSELDIKRDPTELESKAASPFIVSLKRT